MISWPAPRDPPTRILFACNHNSIRSPMAAALTCQLFGARLVVDSVGVFAGEPSHFAAAVMEEVGIDLSSHKPKSFDKLEDPDFDLVISLTPEAHHSVAELTRTMNCAFEYWPTMDPTLVDGSRETILSAYRSARATLTERIKTRFSYRPRPSG
ncbi:MAG: low molecular weight phosphatase family protein [Sphingomonadales bacterium]